MMNTMSLQTLSSISPSEVIKNLVLYTYATRLGKMLSIDSLMMLDRMPDESIDLVVTSPPFALQREKEYGNKKQSEYVGWIKQFGHMIFRKLKSTGSLVLDLGGAYEKGVPVRSLYNYRVLIALCDEIGFSLAEEFFWHNPAKLPSPIEWVNKRKIRVKDSVNTVWWLSKTEWPKADISNVLVPYSDRMKKLIADPDKFYTPKDRPSGHSISKGFSRDNGGAIPSNLLHFSNTDSNGLYLRRCKELGLSGHPARFPDKLPDFFIRMLSDPGDLVVDIFGGSNTTGYVAEQLGRYWISSDTEKEYVATSCLRFIRDSLPLDSVRDIRKLVLERDKVDLSGHQPPMQRDLFG